MTRPESPSGTYTACGTCFRARPVEEFRMPLKESGRACIVKICRPCRVKLWDNPDDPYEGWPS